MIHDLLLVAIVVIPFIGVYAIYRNAKILDEF